MKDKLELQKQYIEVKKKYDELSEEYWNYPEYSEDSIENCFAELDKSIIHKQIKEQFLLLKSLNKQIYYEG